MNEAKSHDTSVRKSVIVHAPIRLAFQIFTQRFNQWWPRTHHIGKVEPYTAILEDRVGGRWFERGADGSECEWGSVLVFDPPRHVAVSWHLNSNFTYDPDPAKASRVDISFHEESGARTRVDLVHSLLDRHGSDGDKVRATVGGEGGWPAILPLFVAAAEAQTKI